MNQTVQQQSELQHYKLWFEAKKYLKIEQKGTKHQLAHLTAGLSLKVYKL